MSTTRLPVGERKLQAYTTDGEPALGTLDERLAILIRRHGGKTSRPTATTEERREYERWRAINAPESNVLYVAHTVEGEATA